MKLGRKEPLFTAKAMRSAYNVNAVLASFGPPPQVSADFVKAVDRHVSNGDWGMLGNDEYGDCTCADSGHALMMRTANTGTMVVPTTADVLAIYTAITGFNPQDPGTDQGAMEGDVCRYMISHGLLGHKSMGTAPIVTGKLTLSGVDHLKWGMQVFGVVRLGVNLPASAEDQFPDYPWSLSGDLTITGGHDVPLVKYDTQYAYVITWGRVQRVEWSWLLAFCEEAHAEVYPDFIRASGTSPSGFHLNTMIRDLGALAV